MTPVTVVLRSCQQRALAAMFDNTHGQIIAPTGAGKSIIIAKDIERHLKDQIHKVIVVVAPRILLANQLCEEFITLLNGVVEYVPGHVHSGETYHWSNTKPEQIAAFVDLRLTCNTNVILFTTYNSLGRIVESGIPIDVIYYDEAHNAVQRNFFQSVLNIDAKRYYFFTATPKHTRSPMGRGMNNRMVYGPILVNIPAPELVNSGSILPPEVSAYEVDIERQKGQFSYENDRDMLVNFNVHGLTHTVFLRQLDIIQMAQTVGRVIRLNKDDADDIACGKITPGKFEMYRKPSGKVIVPVFKNYGAPTIKRLQSIVETIFVKGLPAISTTA